ncbi:chromate transporter [Paenibacillus sp. J31TS4]|uniref:chromate efflux transporter n=1 Tax=Paenibacillus sp. J31TS4 TaxID=2807195 RepID=UPI001B04254C|nr:chromate efflux transporter [Paenibacillus sp. J31TS4]GIP37828.1 chromate transporter [Paenibacillus sp. J31TS4]
MNKRNADRQGQGRALLEVLLVSLQLGLTSFGGPVAHLGYFHEVYVRKKQWLDERSYADLVALCQFLPGPASSQVGIGIGTLRAGWLGGVAAWAGFTLPSALALILFAFAVQSFAPADAAWLHGLKLAAVAVVAQAIAGMSRSLAQGRARMTIAAAAAAIVLLWPSPAAQVAVLAAAALAGLALFRRADEPEPGALRPPSGPPVSRRAGALCLALFAGLLLALPVLRGAIGSPALAVFDSFYRSGSLVFGGGHVVLPLLERETVPSGWVSEEVFLAGYGAAQAVPGPLFTFASYLGAALGGLPGAVLATAAIFLPAYLLVLGVLPFWEALRRRRAVHAALAGMNAAVVGLLLAAFYDPIWTRAVGSPADAAFAGILFVLLAYWKLPPWLLVAIGAAGGMLLPV